MKSAKARQVIIERHRDVNASYLTGKARAAAIATVIPENARLVWSAEQNKMVWEVPSATIKA